MLPPDSQVMKLVGPILITVDLEEARENVGKRLEFIEAEVHKIDAAIGMRTMRILLIYRNFLFLRWDVLPLNLYSG